MAAEKGQVIFLRGCGLGTFPMLQWVALHPCTCTDSTNGKTQYGESGRNCRGRGGYDQNIIYIYVYIYIYIPQLKYIYLKMYFKRRVEGLGI